jgi:hypothetical protein
MPPMSTSPTSGENSLSSEDLRLLSGSLGDIIRLLHAVYRHYPVGYFYLKDKYPGYQEMKEIVAKKMNSECNDPLSISNVFARDLQEQLGKIKVINRNYENFPNYVFDVRISSKHLIKLAHSCYLTVCISLLCDYYTLFFVDEFSWKGPKDANNQPAFHPSPHYVYSFNTSLPKANPQLMANINLVLRTHFPGKTYISHALLMEPPFFSRVAPFGQSVSPQEWDNYYSFYSLLFSYEYAQHIQILD